MICPYCNHEMKVGEIADSFRFNRNMVSPQLYTEEKEEIALTCFKSPLAGIVGAKFPCYYCLHCHKVILDIPT